MRTLRLFVDVVRHRSFSRAAAESGITQSAASQRVSTLEKQLGVALIDRSVRPLALTAAGEVFLRGVRDLLDRYDALEQSVLRMKPRELSGQVRVAAIYSAGIDLLSHVRQSFIDQHPGVTVTIDYEHPQQAYASVRERRVDLGIVSYPQTWRDVVARPLRDELMALVCPTAHPLATAQSVHASELAETPLLGFEADLPVAREIRRYLREQGVTPRMAHEFDNIDTLRSAVAATGCAAILPARLVARETASGELSLVELEPRLIRPVGIVHRRPSVRLHGPNGPARGRPPKPGEVAPDAPDRPHAPQPGPDAAGASATGLAPVVEAFMEFLIAHAEADIDSEHRAASLATRH